MKFAERKHDRHKGKKGRRKPVKAQAQAFTPPRNKGGVKPGTQNNLQAGLNPSRRLLRDVTLHGTRSVALEHLTNGEAAWAAGLREWKDSLVVSLGGWDTMSVECHEILAQLAVSKVIVDSLSAYAIANAPVNRQKHKVFPWVMERDKLVATYTALLRQLRETVQANRKPAFDPTLDGHLDGEE